MIYGPYADRATIPAARRAALVGQLATQGVASGRDLGALGARIAHARAERAYRPQSPGVLFYPPLPERDF
jgi:hypothetical protein